MQKIKREELDSWRKGVEAAWQAISERVKADKSTIQAAYDAQRKANQTDRDEAKQKKGVLKLTISNPDKLEGAKLSVAGDESEWDPGTRSRVFANLQAGHRTVVLDGKIKGGKEFRIEDVVLIKKGTKTDLAVAPPSQ